MSKDATIEETGECYPDKPEQLLDFAFKGMGDIRFYKSGIYVYAVGTMTKNSSNFYIWTSMRGKKFIPYKILDLTRKTKEFKIYAEGKRVVFGISSISKSNKEFFDFYLSEDAGKIFEHCTPSGPFDRILDFNVLLEGKGPKPVVARIFTLEKGKIIIYARRWW
jgi:hypothetical protein